MKMLDGWERGHPARRSHGIAPWKALRAGCPRSDFHRTEGALHLFSSANCRDASLRSLESHVIPAKAGIQFVFPKWTPACAGLTARLSYLGVGRGWRIHCFVCMRPGFGVSSGTPYEAATSESNVVTTPTSSLVGTHSPGPRPDKVHRDHGLPLTQGGEGPQFLHLWSGW
jgi:hypothetical protein